jgi:hypothetical protein
MLHPLIAYAKEKALRLGKSDDFMLQSSNSEYFPDEVYFPSFFPYETGQFSLPSAW